MPVQRSRLAALIDRERAAYRANHARSAAAFDSSASHLLGGVPMTWMGMWSGGFPLYLESAAGARLTDIAGPTSADFGRGAPAAMAGHSPGAVQETVTRRYCDLGGATTMLPTEDADWVAAELTRRFGGTSW